MASSEIKAPGLQWRVRKDGRCVAYWTAASAYVKRGYKPTVVRLTREQQLEVISRTFHGE